MTAPTPDQLERLVVMAEDNDPEAILSNLRTWALDGDSPHAEAVLMAEAAITISAALQELQQARQSLAEQKRTSAADLRSMTAAFVQASQMLADAPHDGPRDGDDGYGCQVGLVAGAKCTCWKAGL